METNELNLNFGLLDELYRKYIELHNLCKSTKNKEKCLNIMITLIGITNQTRELIDTLTDTFENNS